MKKLVGIFLVALVVGCGTRKTEQIKEVEKIKLVDTSSLIDLSDFKMLYREYNNDKGFVYTREKDGLKETFTQNNKEVSKLKIVDSVRYKLATIYKTLTTYKSIKNKKTQSDGVSYWVWFTGLFFTFLFAIIWNWKMIITRYKRN
jgi:hypothetical protein